MAKAKGGGYSWLFNKFNIVSSSPLGSSSKLIVNSDVLLPVLLLFGVFELLLLFNDFFILGLFAFFLSE